MSEIKHDIPLNEDLPVAVDAAAQQAAPTACRFEPCVVEDSDGNSDFWVCPHPPERDGWCLYHLAKLTPEEQSKLSASELSAAEQLDNRCRGALKKLILQTEADPNVDAHKLYGFEVPWGFGLPHQELEKPLKFRHSRFHGDASFALCETLDADFREVEFFGITRFVSVKFHGRTQFTEVHFHEAVEFHSVNFDGYANFDLARFEGRADFVGFPKEPTDYCPHPGESVFQGLTYFRKLSFAGDARLSFTNLSLDKADFYDTDLEHVQFIAVKWSTLKGRQSLWGEVRLVEIDRDPAARERHGIHDFVGPQQIEKLAETYAQLVLNYERHRDVDTAEDFHIGEMEMRRRKVASGIEQSWLRAIRERCNGFGVYRLSSIYGTSYTRAAWVLACIVLSFSLLFLWTGIAPVPGDTWSAAGTIQYKLLPDADHPRVALGQWLDDYTKALVFTMSVATFQKDRSFQPAGHASEILAMLTVIVIGAQGALLLFAVRRRFKR